MANQFSTKEFRKLLRLLIEDEITANEQPQDVDVDAKEEAKKLANATKDAYISVLKKAVKNIKAFVKNINQKINIKSEIQPKLDILNTELVKQGIKEIDSDQVQKSAKDLKRLSD